MARVLDMGGKVEYISQLYCLFYYLIKWKLINMLINYLIKNQIFF